MFKVGITGGIGSGKSTVCRLFAARGVAVYDTDAAAKRLMAEDVELKAQIVARFGAASYQDGDILSPHFSAPAPMSFTPLHCLKTSREST